MVSSRRVESSSASTSGTCTPGLRRKHVTIQREVLGFVGVVEFFAQARGDLGMDLAGIDRRIEAAISGERELELPQVGLHHGLHVGVLQLAGQRGAVVGRGAMHLTERGRVRGFAFEARLKRLCQSLRPSSAVMRRLTNGQPI